LILAFVLWVLSLAFLYAMVQSQTGGDAVAGAARIAHNRVAIFAGQSALEEATHVARTPVGSQPSVLDELQNGSRGGVVGDPAATRDAYGPLAQTGGGRGAAGIARKVRRRFAVRVCQVVEMEGPRQGEVLYSALSLAGEPLFEVVER
jgi:hypothetical protein